MYKNYIFDLYGTLIDLHTDEEKASLWEGLSLFMGYQGALYTPEELKKRYLKITAKLMEANHQVKYPDIDMEDVFYSLYRDKEVKAKSKLLKYTTQIFRLLSTDYIRLFEGVLPLLKDLKAMNKKLYLLSNAQHEFLMAELKIFELEKYFDAIYISSDYGMCKPEKAFFEKVIKENDLKVKDTIMIGNDYSTDIKGAISMGMDSLYIQTPCSNLKVKAESATFEILDGDFNKIKEILLQKQ